jgi:hypothetical protein
MAVPVGKPFGMLGKTGREVAERVGCPRAVGFEERGSRRGQ